jgi:hypothetical protein
MQLTAIIEAHHLSTTYTNVSNVLFLRVIPYVREITEERECGFRYNGSVISQV